MCYCYLYHSVNVDVMTSVVNIKSIIIMLVLVHVQCHDTHVRLERRPTTGVGLVWLRLRLRWCITVSMARRGVG